MNRPWHKQIILDNPGGPSIILKAGGKEKQKRKSEWEKEVKMPHGWRKGPHPRNASDLEKVEKARKQLLTLSSQKECGPANTLTSSLKRPTLTTGPQNYKIVNFCCKPLRLWYFVTAAIGNWIQGCREEKGVRDSFMKKVVCLSQALKMVRRSCNRVIEFMFQVWS